MKEFQDKAKNIWLLNGQAVDIAQDICKFLFQNEFDIKHSGDKQSIKIAAVNKIRLPKLFFRLKKAEIIDISLNETNAFQTQMEIKYKFSGKFWLLSYSVITIIIGIMLGAICCKLDGPWIPIREIAGIGSYIALLYVFFRIFINTNIVTLFNYLDEHGFHPSVINLVAILPANRNIAFFALSVLSIGAIIVGRYDLQTIISVLLLIGACWLVLLVFTFPPIDRMIRSPGFMAGLFFSATFALYGFLPIVLLLSPITANSLLFGLLSIIPFFLLLRVTRTALFESLKAINYSRSNLLQITENEKYPLFLSISIALLWSLLSIVCIFSTLFSIIIINFCVLGRDYIFAEQTIPGIIHGIANLLFPLIKGFGSASVAQLLVKIGLIIYFTPIVFIAGYIFCSNIKQIFEYAAIICSSNYLKIPEFIKAQDLLSRISQNAGITRPYLRVIESDYINAYCLLPPIPGIRKIIILTLACRELPGKQLEALIAHEMGHLNSKHPFALSILSFLSRWTFLGESFASLLTKSPQAMEKEADRFAINWLEQSRPRGRTALLELLKTIEKQRIKMSLCQSPKKEFMAFPAFAVANNAEQLIKESVDYSEKKYFAKRRFDFKILIFFIFHGWMSTYIHVPYDTRIKHIRELNVRG